MKKTLAAILAMTLTVAGITGCSGTSNQTVETTPKAETTAAAAAQSAEPATEKAAESSGKTIVLRLAETQTETYPATMGAIEFARLVEERSNGRIKIEVFTGGQLGGDEQAVIEQIQFGAIDMSRVNLAPMTEFAPVLNLFQMPFLFENSDHMHKVIDSELGEQMLSSVENSNFVGLALYEAGTRNFYNSVKPITKMEDMKGLKIRSTQSQLIIDMIESLGAVPTPMAFGEVYSSLQTGVIDGAENNWVSYDQNSHFEVAKHLTLDGHTAPPEILICSKMVFDKLSAEDQELIKQAAKDSVIYEREQYGKVEQVSREKVIAGGAQVVELENRSEFEEAVAPLYEKYAGDFMDELEQIKAMK